MVLVLASGSDTVSEWVVILASFWSPEGEELCGRSQCENQG